MGKMKEVAGLIDEAEKLKARFEKGKIETSGRFSITTCCCRCANIVFGNADDGFVCAHCGFAFAYDYKHPIEEKMKEKEKKGGQKFDDGKLPYDVIPFECLDELAKILACGIKKYGKPSGWQYVENMENRYFAAAMRHLSAYRQGERRDEESGELHIAHAFCNILFLLWKELQAKEVEGDKDSYWNSLLKTVDTRY